MSYKKAVDVLPSEILKILQQYVEGEYIYIPKREHNKKTWGANTSSKQEVYIRNLEIYKRYIQGESTNTLAKQYYLSQKTIQKIIRHIKKCQK